MTVIEHTIVAMISLIIAFAIGHWMGKRQGSLFGIAITLEWIEKKVGTATFNRWMREREDTL